MTLQQALAAGTAMALVPCWTGVAAGNDPAGVRGEQTASSPDRVTGDATSVSACDEKAGQGGSPGGRSLDASHRLLRCLSAVVKLRPADAHDAGVERASFTARRLVLEGLRVEGAFDRGEAMVRCRAERVVVEEAVLSFPGGVAGASGSVRASRMVLEGPVEMMARQVEGRLLGLLPVVLSGPTHTSVFVPALTVQWMELTDVRISGLVLRTKAARISDAALQVGHR
ncbi:hypothetical protein QNO07_10825 [Streptomyces sp. 549]|uniref:hypothetical protein n=1 Tax=Streptomyces sp. 549 TaxID=3049076 RepID=UPI0024C37462|nr:hypothetical protein [Streptomyces sp. 549]MDK1473903.1 hypothetical protein [Streptomyces sp. 549]